MGNDDNIKKSYKFCAMKSKIKCNMRLYLKIIRTCAYDLRRLACLLANDIRWRVSPSDCFVIESLTPIQPRF